MSSFIALYFTLFIFHFISQFILFFSILDIHFLLLKNYSYGFFADNKNRYFLHLFGVDAEQNYI